MASGLPVLVSDWVRALAGGETAQGRCPDQSGTFFLFSYSGGILTVDGNFLTRSTRALMECLRHPTHGARWVSERAHPRSPIALGLPWIAWSAIDYLEAWIEPQMRVFEWGCGGSTRFFLNAGCCVTTVESEMAWAERVENSCRKIARPPHIRLVPTSSLDRASQQSYIASVCDGAPWDIVMIDGIEESWLSRVECVKEAASRVRPGGMLILDDAWRQQYWMVPEILAAWDRIVFRGLGPARLGVTQTDIYLATNATS